MSERLTPYPAQQVEIDRMIAEPTRAALLAAELGTGKTLMACEVVRGLGAQTVLIIGPLNTKGGWRGTIRAQEIGLPFREIDATKAGAQAHADLSAGVPGAYFVGREFFHLSASSVEPKLKSPAILEFDARDLPEGTYTFDAIYDGNRKEYTVVVEEGEQDIFAIELEDMNDLQEASTTHPNATVHLPKLTRGRVARWSWTKVKPDIAIYDEVHAVSNRWSNGFAVLKTLKPGYKLALSATAQGNKFRGIWSVCRWLWPDEINPATGEHYVARGQWAWAYQWANVSDDYFAGKVIGDEKVPGAFVASLPCYVRLESNLKDAQEIKVYVDLTPAQRKMYEQMQAQDLAWLEDHPLVADLPIVKQQRLRQMALGTVQFNDKDEVDFADDTSSAKIDALVEQIIPEHEDEPMLILTCSKKFAKVVAKRLGPTAVEWSGDVNAKTRAEIKVNFGKDPKYIVAQIQSVAEGIDGWQRVCHIVVWMSELVGNPTLNHQAAGRINRTGQTKTVLSYRLLANNTADDGTFDSLVAQARSNRASLTI